VGSKYTWAYVARQNGIGHLREVEPGAADIDWIDRRGFARPRVKWRVEELSLELESVWMPGEGRFEPLLQMDFLSAFEAAGPGELIHVPEFRVSILCNGLVCRGLRKREEAFPNPWDAVGAR